MRVFVLYFYVSLSERPVALVGFSIGVLVGLWAGEFFFLGEQYGVLEQVGVCGLGRWVWGYGWSHW